MEWNVTDAAIPVAQGPSKVDHPQLSHFTEAQNGEVTFPACSVLWGKVERSLIWELESLGSFWLCSSLLCELRQIKVLASLYLCFLSAECA